MSTLQALQRAVSFLSAQFTESECSRCFVCGTPRVSLDARACYPVQSNVACVAGMLCCLEVCFASGMQVHMLVCMQICICKILEKLGTDCIFF